MDGCIVDGSLEISLKNICMLLHIRHIITRVTLYKSEFYPQFVSQVTFHQLHWETYKNNTSKQMYLEGPEPAQSNIFSNTPD